MHRTLKCPICEIENLRSHVMFPTGLNKIMSHGKLKFADEQGNLHIHYPEIKVPGRCSQGHNFFFDLQKPCGACGWTAGSDVEVDIVIEGELIDTDWDKNMGN